MRYTHKQTITIASHNMYGLNSTMLQITEELEHQINISPGDWAAGHRKPLRHDYRIITSKLPPKSDPAGGVTMMMDKTMWAACVVTSEDRQPQRQRIVWATFRREKMSNIVVIGVYAPSQGHRNPTPKQFREELQKVLDYFSTHQILLFGDLNVQLARNTQCTGRWSVHSENVSQHSKEWAEFLIQNDLFVVSTKFQPAHRGGSATWMCRNAAAAGRHKRVPNDYEWWGEPRGLLENEI
jgi:exonuclease III